MPKILIVEDDADIVENLSVLLQDEGFSFCHAPDTKGALDFVHTENIDLVLLDITLSDGNGYSVCTAVNEAISNILKNCIEHCEVGGNLEITSSENPIYTEIVISDNGEGFHEKDIPHLFERFYRGSNAVKESAGIGLNLSRMIISKQNGTISAANKPNGGAQFTIRFYKGAI